MVPGTLGQMASNLQEKGWSPEGFSDALKDTEIVRFSWANDKSPRDFCADVNFPSDLWADREGCFIALKSDLKSDKSS